MKCIAISVLFLLFSCSKYQSLAEQESPWVTEAYKNMGTFTQDICQNYGFELSGFGGSMMYNIKKQDLSFHSYQNKRLAIDQARSLFLNIAQDLIEKTNRNENIRPYLAQYPIDYHNIELDIAFYEKNGRRVPSEYVAFVYLAEGKIHYCFYDSEKKKFIDEKDFSETYEEALEKLRQQTPTKPLL